MSENEKKIKKEKAPRRINPFVLLFCIIIVANLATYVVSPGAFDRQEVNGKDVVVADSYHPIEKSPLNLLEIFRSVSNGLVGSSAIMFLIMLVGGYLEVYKRTGAMDKGISRIIAKADKWGSQTILLLIMIVFAMIGGFLGWAEQIIPFVPLIVSLCLALGYDMLERVAHGVGEATRTEIKIDYHWGRLPCSTMRNVCRPDVGLPKRYSARNI